MTNVSFDVKMYPFEPKSLLVKRLDSVYLTDCYLVVLAGNMKFVTTVSLDVKTFLFELLNCEASDADKIDDSPLV